MIIHVTDKKTVMPLTKNLVTTWYNDHHHFTNGVVLLTAGSLDLSQRPRSDPAALYGPLLVTFEALLLALLRMRQAVQPCKVKWCLYFSKGWYGIDCLNEFFVDNV